MHTRLVRFAAAIVGVVGLARPVASQAQVPLVNDLGGTVGFGTQCLSPNDDGSSDSVDLSLAFPNGLRFFSGTYRSLVVNTNGNVTFNGALPTYTPAAFPVANLPMIAPYWADVDIRPSGCGGLGDGTGSAGNDTCMNPTSNGVWWHVDQGRFIATWDTVGYFRCHLDHVMSFQLILTDASSCGAPGDFDVEFRFHRCEWTTGDASSGSGGFGGVPAQAGFDAGDDRNYFAVPGSLMPDIHTRMCTGTNTGTAGLWRFSIRNGTVTMGGGGSQTCGVGACRRTVLMCIDGNPIPCAPGAPTAEQCDGMDHDCNGVPNDGVITCGVGACRRSVPLCMGSTMLTCVPGRPRPESCDGIDNDCNGIVDECCHDTGARGDDAGCIPWPRLEGRAGPYGGCRCQAPGIARTPFSASAMFVASMLAVAALVRRRSISRSPRSWRTV